jgi:hypothetical protein
VNWQASLLLDLMIPALGEPCFGPSRFLALAALAMSSVWFGGVQQFLCVFTSA